MKMQVLCDASCTDISRSTAADWLLKVRHAGRQCNAALQQGHPPQADGLLVGPAAALLCRLAMQARRRAKTCCYQLPCCQALLPAVNWSHCLPIHPACMQSAYWATWKTSWVRVDERTIHINDTGARHGCFCT